MSLLRQRKSLVKFVQDLDAFPKVEDDHQEKTASGGGLSLLVFALITILVIFEINHYMDEGAQYHYDIDPNFDKKLRLNIDIMVAMKCSDVGADILDLTGENAAKFGSLKEQNVNFELSPRQQKHFDYLRAVNSHVKQDYHRIHGNLWRQLKNFPRYSVDNMFAQDKEESARTHDACRFHGSLEVNKIAGNFHIVAGKSINLGNNHMHLSFDADPVFNFSHRILHFSFGDSDTPLLNPLDAEVKISNNPNHIWQYFMQVVPTTATSFFRGDTDIYQYAVTEQNRTVNHGMGSHGLPGIYVKYDLSPIRVKVEDGSSTLVQLVIRLCGIVGGVYATSSFFHLIVSGLVDEVCCGWLSKAPSPPSTHAYTLLNKQEVPNGSILRSSDLPDQIVSLVATPSESKTNEIRNEHFPSSVPVSSSNLEGSV